jgi:hypothetical protein
MLYCVAGSWHRYQVDEYLERQTGKNPGNPWML